MISAATREGVRETSAKKNSPAPDALVTALGRLEGILGEAAQGREARWVGRFVFELWEVRREIGEHKNSAEAGDGILAQIEQAMPGAPFRVGRLREDHDKLIAVADALLADVDRHAAADGASAERVKREASSLLWEMRRHQEREVDLFMDAFESDFGVVE